MGNSSSLAIPCVQIGIFDRFCSTELIKLQKPELEDEPQADPQAEPQADPQPNPDPEPQTVSVPLEEYQALQTKLAELEDDQKRCRKRIREEVSFENRSAIRQKVFDWKIDYQKDPASFDSLRKSDVYNHFALYDQKVRKLVKTGWRWEDTVIVEKATVHEGAPKGHKSYLLRGRMAWGKAPVITDIHPCTSHLTEQ